jgi:hypothetical protein
MESFRWPVGDENVETYDPARRGWPDEKPLSLAADIFIWVLVLAIVGSGIARLLWVVGVF